MRKIYPLARRARTAITWCAIAFLGAYLLRDAVAATRSVANALEICVTRVIPSLFPYMVLCSLILTSGLSTYIGRLLSPVCRTLFALNGSCATSILMGFVSGFPLGAKSAAATYEAGLCTKEEAQRLCAFCNNTGPSFLVGGVGAGIFGDARVGVALYVIQVACALLLGIAMSFGKSKKTDSIRQTVRFTPDFTGAVKDGVNGVLGVCGFVVFFSVLNDVIGAVITDTPLEGALPLIAALSEVTGGCAAAAQKGGETGFVLAAFSVGFSGICVHAQSAQYLAKAGLSVKKYVLGKLFLGAMCAVTGYILCVFSRNL